MPIIEYDLDLAGIGRVPVSVDDHDHDHDHDHVQSFLLLHGGAGPISVAAFGDLMANRKHTRVLVPTHPGFNGTLRPAGMHTVTDLAMLYAALLDRLDLTDVTVIGNSIGGWIAAELALLGNPRVSGAVLVDAVGIDVPGHPVADVSQLTGDEIAALSYHEPERFGGGGGPDPKLVTANMSTLFGYAGARMSDPTLLDRLSGMAVPVHVIWGTADRIVTPEYGRAYADAIPESRFTLLPDTGHLPPLETPEQLLGAIWEVGA